MLNCSHLKTSDVGQWKGSESDPDCGDGVITEPSEARRQRGRRARGDAGHVAEHGRGAGTQVDQVVLCGLIQHLWVKKRQKLCLHDGGAEEIFMAHEKRKRRY